MTATSQSWLDIQCEIIPGIIHAVVMKHDKESKQLKISAVWPRDIKQIPEDLISVSNQVADKDTAVVRTQGEDKNNFHSIIGCPLKSDTNDAGIAVVEIAGQASSKTQGVLKLLKWGGIWFNLLHSDVDNAGSTSRLAMVAELLVGTLEHDHFKAAAKTAVTQLASQLECERVTLGLLKKRHIVIQAVSHNAEVDPRSSLLREIASAMEECIDQDATIAYPPLPKSVPHVSFAQEVLSQRNNGKLVFTTPLYSAGQPIGAMTFEMQKDSGFNHDKQELCESVGALLGPILELKYQHDRAFFIKILDNIWNVIAQLLGAKYLLAKILCVGLISGLFYLSTESSVYRLRAPAILEAKFKQIITSPQEGYIYSSSVRAGDWVEKGNVLAMLDTKDIKLERFRLESEYEQFIMQHRAGLLNPNDRSKAAIANAQIKQTKVKMQLLDEQLQRAQITAPFDGVVVSGDLSQLLGSPLKSGQEIFQIAPVDSYRVRILIDEQDIGEVHIGSEGELALTGLPNQTLALKVERLLPVSEALDGKNVFHVEASIAIDNPLLRPGMEGIAKVDVEQRKLLWIWFHELIYWSRLQIWIWLG